MAVAAVGKCGGMEEISMKRILMMVFRNLLYVPYGFIKLLWYAAHEDRYTEEQKFRLLREINDRAVRTGNVHIDVKGLENIPDKDGFILYPNHQGMFDVLAILKVCPKNFAVVTKKEVSNILFLKQVFKLMGAISIDREDIKQSMQVILQVIKGVKEGKNYLIFAEGTRSKQGNIPGEFKGGSFKAATKPGCPIVPVALIDSFKPFDTGTTKMTTVKVRFLPPMYQEEYKDMHTTEIAAEVKRRIEEVIKKEC